MVWMDADLTRRHYFDLEERFGPAVFNAMAEFMESGPVIAMILEGVEAVATHPQAGRLDLPGPGASRHHPR